MEAWDPPEGFVLDGEPAPVIPARGKVTDLSNIGLPSGFIPKGEHYDALQPFINAASDAYSVPPDIVRGIVWKESNYHPDIVYGKRVGNAGDSGAMQLIPGTARGMGVKDVFDPADNILGGTRYLRDLYDELGDWGKAVAAYNSGSAHKLFSSNPKANPWDAPNYSNYVLPVMETAGKFAKMRGASPAKQGREKESWQVPDGFVLVGDEAPPAQPEIRMPTAEENADWGKQRPDIAANHDPADYTTLQKAAFAADPQTAFKIFAGARFPGDANAYKRYGVNQFGRIYYRDNSGTEYEEIPESFENSIKKAFSYGVANVPEMAGAGFGAAAGGATPWSIPLAMVGAMPGRYLKQKIGEYLGDKQKSAYDTATNLAEAGLEAGVGDAAGHIMAGSTNKLLRSGTGPGVIGKMASRDLPYFDQAAMDRIVDLGRQFGIDVTAPEVTGSPSLISLWNKAATTPGRAAEMVRQWAESTRIPQLQAAVERELGNISPEASVYAAGQRGAQAAKGVQDTLIENREAAAGPFYKEAFQNQQPVNIQPVVDRIDDMLANELPVKGGDSRKMLLKVRDMLVTGTEEGPSGSKMMEGMVEPTIRDVYGALDQIRKSGISLKNLRADYGSDGIKIIQRKFGPGVIRQNSGMGLDELAATYGYESGDDLFKALAEYKPKYLAREQLQQEIASQMPETAGAPALKLEDRLKVLDNAKKQIDAWLDGPLAQSVDIDTHRRLAEIKDGLTAMMDVSNPAYLDARNQFYINSKPLNDFMYANPNLMPKDPKAASAVARIAALPEGRFHEAPQILFGPDSSIEMIRHAKGFIQQADPEAWDALIRGHLQKRFDNMKFGDPMTMGDRFADKIFGTPRQAAMLKEAMGGQQFQRMSDFMDLLNVTNRIVYRNSLTAQQLGTGEMMEREAAGQFGKVLNWASTKISPARAADQLGKMNLPEYSAKVVNALLDPAMQRRITQIKQLSSGQAKAIEVLGLIGTMYGEDYGVRELTGPRNIAPEYSE